MPNPTPHAPCPMPLPLVGRVLIIGPSNIGDAILVSPVVARLSAAYPQASLTLLVGRRAQAVFTHDPRIAQLWCMEEFHGLGRLRLAQGSCPS